MKINVKNYLWLLFAGVIGLSSCKKDEEVPAPTLTFTLDGAASGSFNSSEIVEFKMNLGSDNDFTSLKGTLVYTKKDMTTVTVTLKDANNSNKEMDYTKNSDIEAAYEGTKIVKVALPADAKEATEWTITVEAATSGGKTTATFKGKVVNSYLANLLGAQNNTANPSFFSTTNGTRYNSADAKANATIIDIGYGFGNFASTNSDHLISYSLAIPSNGFYTQTPPPTNATETKFIATNITAPQFTDNSTSWKALLNGIIPSTTSVKIEEGKVYAYKNAAGKMGLVHIKSITSGLSGEIEINVKAEN
jgi:hypothetical protein